MVDCDHLVYKPESDDLIRQLEAINRHHREARENARNALEHVRAAGELLATLKASLPRGQFQRVVAKHDEFSDRTARSYLAIAAALLDGELICDSRGIRRSAATKDHFRNCFRVDADQFRWKRSPIDRSRNPLADWLPEWRYGGAK